MSRLVDDVDVRGNSPALPRNFSKAHSRTMESSSRLRPSRQRASGASCSTLRAHPPCAAAVRLFRRGRRKKGEKRRDFETRSLGDGRDAFASRVTRHWHDTSRRVASRLLAFTRSTGNANTIRTTRAVPPWWQFGLASCHSSSSPNWSLMRAPLAPRHLLPLRGKRLADGRRGGSGHSRTA